MPFKCRGRAEFVRNNEWAKCSLFARANFDRTLRVHTILNHRKFLHSCILAILYNWSCPHVCNFLTFNFKTSPKVNTQYEHIVGSRTELHNPSDGPTPENSKSQNWRFYKIILQKSSYFISEYLYERAR